MTDLPKLKYPWFAYPNGRGAFCARCHQPIDPEEPRAWSASSKTVMHLDCHGAFTMGDHGGPEHGPEEEPAKPEESPPRESREEAIERMHGDNMTLLIRIAMALEGIERNIGKVRA